MRRRNRSTGRCLNRAKLPLEIVGYLLRIVQLTRREPGMVCHSLRADPLELSSVQRCPTETLSHETLCRQPRNKVRGSLSMTMKSSKEYESLVLLREEQNAPSSSAGPTSARAAARLPSPLPRQRQPGGPPQHAIQRFLICSLNVRKSLKSRLMLQSIPTCWG